MKLPKLFRRKPEPAWSGKLVEGGWTCHICGENRPNDKISVCSRVRGLITVNVRYCNDRQECINAAPQKAMKWFEV